MLRDFIAVNRDEIIRRCQRKVARRSMSPVTPAEIDHGVPLFLDQLLEVLRDGSSTATIRTTSVLHGHDLQLQGLTVGQVVHDYGNVCQSITELAMETHAPIDTEDFHTLNRCLDDAIAGAVTEFGRARGQHSQEARETASRERLGFFTHELRNLTHTAIVAFDVLQTGNVGLAGSTAAVLRRSLTGLVALIEKSLAEVRLTRAIQNRELFSVSGFIGEIAAAAALDAQTNGIELIVRPGEDACLEADRRSLAAVMQNLLQNAIKFTKPHSTITLRVRSTTDRVLIEVEDECGGLPVRDAEELFDAFEQRSADRSGLGIGLAFCRWAVQANHGVISARSLPGTGCVFTVDLPRCDVPAGA